ncbi:hypothetical protein AWF81_11025 [Escherichia coli]|nr:hypothetical protein AWF81_11025 [Escherichia coli]
MFILLFMPKIKADYAASEWFVSMFKGEIVCLILSAEVFIISKSITIKLAAPMRRNAILRTIVLMEHILDDDIFIFSHISPQISGLLPKQ